MIETCKNWIIILIELFAVGFHDDALSIIQTTARHSKVLLALPHVIPQFYYMGSAGTMSFFNLTVGRLA